LIPAQAGLLFVFSSPDGSIARNDVNFGPASFTIEALVTAPLQPGASLGGGERYAVNTLWLTMPSQGLNRFVSNSTFNVDIGLPAISIPDAVVLTIGGPINGIFHPQVPGWNRLRAVPLVTGLPSLASRDISFNLVNGDSIQVVRFDKATGSNDASLRVDLVPEPASLLALRRRNASR
jgi:hypothetical protein